MLQLRVSEESDSALLHLHWELNVVLCCFHEGHGIFCIDVKPWRGTVSTHKQNWHVQLKEVDQNISNTCIEQIEDPLKAIMVIIIIIR